MQKNKKFNLCIVEPTSSAIYLAKRLKEENIGSIIIKITDSGRSNLTTKCITTLKNKILYQEFDMVIEFDMQYDCLNQLFDTLLKLGIGMVISGSEYGVELTDELANIISPKLANNRLTSQYRYNKYWMQEALRIANLSAIPEALIDRRKKTQNLVLEKFITTYSFPFIIKPVNSTGSTAVKLVYNRSQLEKYFLHNKDSEELVIQKFIQGTEYFADTFSYKGKHYISGIFVYQKQEQPDGSFLYRTATLLDEKDPLTIDINKKISSILSAAGLKNGWAHTEFIIDEIGDIYLIEINPRISGASGALNIMTKHINGFDQIDLMKACITNKKLIKPSQVKTHGCLFCLFNSQKNKIFNGVDEKKLGKLNSFSQLIINKKIGTKLKVYGSLLECVAFIILINNDISSLQKDINTIFSLENSGALLI